MNSFKGKTILVTGAKGFIGTHLVNRLPKDEGIHLVLLSRKPVAKDRENVTWIHSSLDQLLPEIWQEAGIERIDMVFHLGAFTPKSSADADLVEEVYRDNLLGTRALLESFPNVPERIIFASTLDVYAPPLEGGLLDEGSPLGPSGLYGASKLFCEQLMRAYAKKCGCRYAILRYGHIFGPGEDAYMKLIPLMIRGLLKGEVPVLYGDGSAERDFLYVEDAVEATIRAAASNKAEIGPVNIVRGSSTSIRGIAEVLVRATKFNGDIKYIKDKPNGYSFRFDNSLMHQTLGEWELVSLEEGLRRELEYFRSLGK